MPPKDTRIKPNANGEYDSPITIGELSAILEINQKSIEINLEVEKQNEQVIEALESSDEKLDLILQNQKEIIATQKELKVIANAAVAVIDTIEDYTAETNKEMKDVVSKKVEKINENILKITILLATAGAGTIFNVIQSFIKK